jgi:uncharacterized protein (DUF1501 family)
VDHRHQQFSRRDFLRFSAALGLGSVLGPGWKRGHSAAIASPTGIQWDRQVVLIELDGGNDGLNTVVPFGDPRYYELRPELAIPETSLLRPSALDSEGLGLHPSLQRLMGLWDDGQLAIHQGLGYADSNRSHFRGIDIWNTGSDANEYLSTGWFGRLIDPVDPPVEVVGDAVLLGRYGSNPAAKVGVRSLAMANPRDFVEQAEDLAPAAATTGNRSLDHILRIQNQVQAAVGTIAAAVPPVPDLPTPGDYVIDPSPFPDSALGEQMHATAEMIASGLCFPLYKLSYRGFDTHAGQAEVHAALLADLAHSLQAFRGALSPEQWDRTLVLTYSEFGRRVQENGSRGTDHGTAAPQFICGGAVTGGIYGTQPDLSATALKANRGDVCHSTDFRSLYATAGSFLGFTAAQVQAAFGGSSYPVLPCLGI